MAAKQDAVTSIGLLILRLGVGGFMLTHGLGKLQKLIAGEFDYAGDPIGVGQELSLIGAVLGEFVGALLVVFGFATRIGAAAAAFVMGVAAFVIHRTDPWTMGEAAQLFQSGEAESWASKEPALLYLIPFLALVFLGAGRFSLDSWLWRRWRGRKETTAVEHE